MKSTPKVLNANISLTITVPEMIYTEQIRANWLANIELVCVQIKKKGPHITFFFSNQWLFREWFHLAHVLFDR